MLVDTAYRLVSFGDSYYNRNQRSITQSAARHVSERIHIRFNQERYEDEDAAQMLYPPNNEGVRCKKDPRSLGAPSLINSLPYWADAGELLAEVPKTVS
jgi:hypothetical protein